MMIFTRSIYIRIAVIIGLTYVIATAVTFFSINNTFNRVINSFMAFRLNSALEEMNSDFAQVVSNTEKISGIVKDNNQSMTKKDYEKLLTDIVSSSDFIFGSGVWFEAYQYDKDLKYFGPYVYRDNGTLLFSQIWEGEAYDYFSKKWYRNAFVKNNATVWSAPYVDEILNITFITASKKIVATNGDAIAVATIDVNISKIRKDIAYSLRLGNDSTVFLIDNKGTYIALNNEDNVQNSFDVQENQLLSNIKGIVKTINNEKTYYNENMNDNIVYIKKTDFPGWYMGIAVPREEIVKVIMTLFITISAAILFLTIIIVIMLRFSTSWMKKVFFEKAGTAAAVLDKNMKIILVNDDFIELTGYRKEEIEGKKRFLELISTKDREAVEANFYSQKKKTMKSESKTDVRYEVQIQNIQNECRNILMSNGMIIGTQYALVSMVDITKRKNMEMKLEYLSFHDSLTGLYNRTYFEEALKKLDSEESYAMIICDINGQKLVNDTFGHTVGDQKLRDLAELIRIDLDIRDIPARIGGDEFAIILSGERSKHTEEICEKIRLRIEEYNSNERLVLLGISFGFAKCENKDKTVSEVFIEADNNMYKEKMKYKQGDTGTKIDYFMKIIETRDYEEEGHTPRIIEMAAKMAERYHFSVRRTAELKLLARYHDIGKIGISDAIILKNGPLNNLERSEIQRHSEIGYNIAKSSRELAGIAELILKHQEWWNGEGYPLGIKGDEIPFESRIIGVLDAYDAMMKDRAYRKAMSHKEAVKELLNGAGTQFDPNIVAEFVSLFCSDTF